MHVQGGTQVSTKIKVYSGDTLDSAGGRKHMKALVKAVRENNALSRGRKRANREGDYAHQKRWQDWIALTCPNVPRDEYAGEGGRVKRLTLLAAAGDEPSARSLALVGKRKSAKKAEKSEANAGKSVKIGK